MYVILVVSDRVYTLPKQRLLPAGKKLLGGRISTYELAVAGVMGRVCIGA